MQELEIALKIAGQHLKEHDRHLKEHGLWVPQRLAPQSTSRRGLNCAFQGAWGAYMAPMEGAEGADSGVGGTVSSASRESAGVAYADEAWALRQRSTPF